MAVSLHLPFPPSANTYYRRGPKSTYLSKSGIAYKAAVSDAVAMSGYKLDGRIDLFVALSSPTKRKYDLDNRIKPLQDAMQDAGLYADDEQIDRITVVRHPPTKGGYAKVVMVGIGEGGRC